MQMLQWHKKKLTVSLWAGQNFDSKALISTIFRAPDNFFGQGVFTPQNLE
jgi:hypothetical protein